MQSESTLIDLHSPKKQFHCKNVSNIHIKRFLDFFDMESGFCSVTAPRLSQQVYRLRHKVYCETLGFEKVNETELEKDQFDKRSDYFAVIDKDRGETVACSRLVHSHSSKDLLPLELLGKSALFEGELHPANFVRSEICEISRFTVESKYLSDNKVNRTDKNATYPYIKFYLVLAALKHAAEMGKPHTYTLCEPKLIRYMRLAGINIIRIGSYVSHKGLRQPCYINASEFMQNLPEQFAQMLDRIEQYNLQSLKHQAIA